MALVNLVTVQDLRLALADLLLNIEEEFTLALRGTNGPLAGWGWHTAIVHTAIGSVLKVVFHWVTKIFPEIFVIPATAVQFWVHV